MRSLLATPVSAAAVVGIVATLAAGGGYALASRGGTISGCVSKHGHVLYVGKCKKGDSKLVWNRTGPQGDPGAPGPKGDTGAPGPKGDTGSAGQNGQSVASSTVLAGDANCPSGGSKFSSASGTTYACNGAAGATNVTVRYVDTPTSSNGNEFATAMCDAGEVATGGGTALVSGGDIAQTFYTQPGGQPNVDSGTPTGWFAEWYNGYSSSETIRVYVICASP